MKFTKKCDSTQHKISISNRRCSSAGMFYTSSAGAVTSLILMLALPLMIGSLSLIGTPNLFGFTSNSAFATSAVIRVTSSGAQNVDVKPDASGATATSIGVDNVNIFSTCRSGYNLTIFTSVNDNNLYLNGSSSNNQEGKRFSPADGVGTLINSPNTWGFLVSDTVPDSGSVFQPIPTLNNPRYIRTAEETARDIDIDDDINIYYGVAISSGLPAGSYKLIPDQTTSQDGVVSYGFSMDPACEENTITLNAGNGISTLTASGWTDSGSASISKGFHEGETIDLSTITRGYKTGYTGVKYTVTGGTGTLSGSTYTVGSDDGEITISATGLNTPTCTMQGGTGKVYNRSATTLTATSNATNYDTNSVNLTYSFGYASSATADLGNFTTAGSANTLSVAQNAFRGARHYGVKVVATDKTDSTITSTCTSGTGSSTGTTVANRTTMTLVNSRINFDATTNGGTLSGTTPIYVAYNMSNVYTGRTNATAGSLPSATPPSGKVFDGWYTAASGGNKVINADGTVVASVASWTNASKQWTRTSTSTSATANILYAQYVVSETTFDQAYAAAGKSKYSGYYKIQDGTTSICSAVTQGQIGQVIDTRDNEVYYIGKLEDDKCWMLDNLRLDLTNSTILNSLTTSNTHVNSASLTSLKSGNRSAGAQYASSGFVKWDSSSKTNVYNQAKANASYKDTTTTSYGAGSGKIGIYYNYCAASAGSYCYDSGSGTGNASYDLCPAGWRMPTGGFSGEYHALYTAYSSDTTSFLNALSTPLSGYFGSGKAYDQGEYGYFWSSTYDDGYIMHYEVVYTSAVPDPPDSGDRFYGFSLRCLLGS